MQTLDTVSSYLNTWFARSALASAAVASSGGLCGAGPISSILQDQYFGCSSATHNSELACTSDVQCTWGAVQNCFTYSYCYTGESTCYSAGQMSCPGRSAANCMAPSCLWSNASGQCYSASVHLSDLYQGCSASNGGLNCSLLRLDSWNGTLAGGTDVFNSSRMQGSGTRSLQGNVSCAANSVPGNTPVLPLGHLGCDLRLDLMPGSALNLTAYLPQLQALLGDLPDVLMKFLLQCRSESMGAALPSDSQYNMLYRYTSHIVCQTQSVLCTVVLCVV